MLDSQVFSCARNEMWRHHFQGCLMGYTGIDSGKKDSLYILGLRDLS